MGSASSYTAQLSELVVFLAALFLAPVMYAGFRDLEIPGKRTFVIAYIVLLASYASTLAEAFVLPSFFNFAEHFCMAAAGVAFVLGLWQVLRATRAARAAGP
jgi:hypothetical protein